MGAKAITIIGGGIAGLTLGIALRRRDVPVTLCEAGVYPRHRVCGEFVSGDGLRVLAELGLLEAIQQAGARPARSAILATPTTRSAVERFPQPAFCLSRFALDALLAREFSAAGGILRCGERWKEGMGEGVVRATGRRASMDGDWRWFGVKAHAKNVRLAADLEMHFLPDGYVGICRLSHDEVNACGLFRRRRGDDALFSGVEKALMGKPGSHLHRALETADWQNDSVCAVAGLSIGARTYPCEHECCVGDAMAMIAPLTGNGMSMALESAALGVTPLTAYARGQIPWTTACVSIAETSRRAFHRRLFLGAWLQRAAFNNVLRQAWLPLARFDLAWRVFFRLTR